MQVAEFAFLKLKTTLRSEYFQRLMEFDIRLAILEAASRITPADIRGFFRSVTGNYMNV